METKEDMEYSIEFLEKNGADLINGNILLYLVGSAIWYSARNAGKISADQLMISAPEAGLTPYSYEELREMCIRCTDFSKREGWKRIFRKILRKRKFGLVFSGIREFIKRYPSIRKVRQEVYGYGYGKEYVLKG